MMPPFKPAMKHLLPFLSPILLALATSTPGIGQTLSGSSRIFRVDTRCREFVIADVKSDHCSGAYGIGTKHATFLKGVTANVEFKVTMLGNDIPVERVVVNGTSFSGTSFTFNVGTLPADVCGPLVVVAHGMVNGEDVASPPFRVNCDVARLPTGTDWFWEASSGTYKRPDKEPLSLLPKIEASVDVGNTALAFAGVGRQLKLPIWFDRVPTLIFTEEFDANSGEYKRTAGGGPGKIGGFAGGVINAEVGGAFVNFWDARTAAWEDSRGGAWAKIKMDEVGKTWYPFSPLIGLYVSLRFSGNGAMEIGWDHVNERYYWDAPFDPLVECKGAAGMGWEKLHNVGVWASVGLYAHLSSDNPFELGVDLKAGYAYTDVKNLAEGEQKLETYRKRIELLPVERTTVDDYWNNSDPAIWKRLQAQMCEDPEAAPSLVCTPNGSAQVCLGNAAAALPVENRGIRRTMPGGGATFALQVETGSNVAEERPWDDGTPDSSPQIGSDASGRIFAVWMNARAAYAADASPDDILDAQEIAVAVRDPATGAWNAQNLTDNAILDGSPVLAVGTNGVAFAAWTQNDANESFSTADHPSRLYVSRWVGGTWSAPALVATLNGACPAFDLATDGNRAVLVWSLDEDGKLATVNDYELHAATWNGTAWSAEAIVTDNTVTDIAPKAFFGTNGLYSVVWNSDGEWRIGEEEALNEAVLVPFPGITALPGAVSLAAAGVGRTALFWNTGGEVCAMIFDQRGGEWTRPILVAKSNESILSFGSAFDADGNILVALSEAEAVVSEEGVVTYGESSITRSFFDEGADPAVLAADFAFATNHVESGELVPFAMTVRNLGFVPMQNVTIRFWVCDGNLEQDEEARCELYGETGEPCVLDLPGGAAVVVTNLWVAEDFRTNLTFVAQIELPTGTTDRDLSNNTAVWRPGAPLLSLENARCDAETATLRLLTVTVRNTGLAGNPAGMRVSFRRGSPDGMEIGADIIGAILAGELNGYDAGIAWNMAGMTFTSAWETVWAVIDTGNAETDAEKAAPIRVMTALDTDGDGLLDAEEERIGTNPEKTDTDGDGVPDYDEVYVFFSDPRASGTGTHTITTPTPIPYVWLDGYPAVLASHNGDYEAFGNASASNCANKVWECFVTGLEPTNATSRLEARIEMTADGQPVISWSPDLNEGGTKQERVYTVEGRESLTEGSWGPTNANSRFFKVKVDLP